MDSEKLWKFSSYDGLDFVKGKHSVNMSCNNVCLSNFIRINLFYIYIVWKCNNGDYFKIQNGCRLIKSSVIIIWNKIIYGQTITFRLMDSASYGIYIIAV